MPSEPLKKHRAGLRHCLSVDVEEHFMVEAFADRITRDDWPQFHSRVEANTRRVLDLFARHGVRATFFIVGWTAERNPGLVRDIVDAGHEVGCHSHLHRAIWNLQRDEFRADLRQAIAAIENVAGVKVQGFRAPTFSVVKRTLWALDILAEEGLRYDSSIFPVRHDYYGMPDSPTSIFQWQLPAGKLYEIPMTTVKRLGRNLPAGGGGYLRLLPFWYNRWALRSLERQGRPAVVYLHPWELDPEQPRVQARWKSRLRHYTNLDKMASRVEALVREFSFAPICEVLDRALQQATAENPLPVRSM